MDKEKWREEFAVWLESFAWQWFCSLTFRPGFSQPQAWWRMRKWIGDLRGALGTADFGFIAVPESGSAQLNFHFHVLVTGLSQWHAQQRVNWMRRWYKLAGDARIAQFNPESGGVRYVLKTIGPDDMDSIEFELNSSAQMPTKFGAK